MPRKPSEQGEAMRSKVLEYIIGYIDLHKRPPTIRDITYGVGIKSTSTAEYYVLSLEKRGSIKRTPNVARSISVPDKTRGKYTVYYLCLYPFGCRETSRRPGICRLHGTELVPFVTRR